MTQTGTYETTAEFDIVVLGAGPAGVAAARRAAGLGAHVAIVGLRAQHAAGAIPARVLRAAYADAASPARGEAYGEALHTRSNLQFDELRTRADRVAEQQTASVDSSLRALGVTLVSGRASFDSPHLAHGLRRNRAPGAASRPSDRRRRRPAAAPSDGRLRRPNGRRTRRPAHASRASGQAHDRRRRSDRARVRLALRISRLPRGAPRGGVVLRIVRRREGA